MQLTPQGRGAVSVVLVAGRDSIRIVDSLFQSASGHRLEETADNQICYGHWAGPTGEDVVVVRRSDSFLQGIAREGLAVEVQCHGGQVAAGTIVAELEHAGCRAIDWKEWLCQQEPNAIRAAAQVALAAAPTLRTAKCLLDQCYGAFDTAVEAVIDSIAADDLPEASGRLSELLVWAEFGQHLTAPWKVVLTGNTNVGKSCLINALVGFDRAIVSQTPGTTRDVVTANTAIDGWPVELADTAGIRPSTDDIERQGISRTHATAARADLVIHVTDVIHVSDTHTHTASTPSQHDGRELHVLNKIDLPDTTDRTAGNQLPDDLIFTSALTGQGIAELVHAIGQALVPIVPPSGAAIPLTDEQSNLLRRAQEYCERNDRPSAQKALQGLLAI